MKGAERVGDVGRKTAVGLLLVLLLPLQIFRSEVGWLYSSEQEVVDRVANLVPLFIGSPQSLLERFRLAQRIVVVIFALFLSSSVLTVGRVWAGWRQVTSCWGRRSLAVWRRCSWALASRRQTPLSVKLHTTALLESDP